MAEDPAPNRIAEDALSNGISAFIASKLSGASIPPDTVHLYIANRDEIRSRPCIVIDTPESKRMPLPPDTSKISLAVHLFSQVDDTSAATHAEWAKSLADMLADKSSLKTSINTDYFILHALMLRETSTAPDETRSRETVLTYEAVVSAV